MKKKLKSLLFFPVLASPFITGCSLSGSLVENDDNNSYIKINSTIDELKLEDKKTLIANVEKANNRIALLKTQSKNEVEDELNNVYNEILQIRQILLDKVQNVVNSINQPYNINILEVINSQFYDKNMGITDDEIFKQFSIDVYITKARAINMPESKIKEFLNRFIYEWNEGLISYETTKTPLYESSFLPMDVFKKAQYEMIIFPFLFKKVFEMDYATFVNDEKNSESIYYKPDLKYSLRIWKIITSMDEMCAKNNKYDNYKLNDVIKQQYFYKWFNAFDYEKSWNESGFVLDEYF